MALYNNYIMFIKVLYNSYIMLYYYKLIRYNYIAKV